MALLQESPCRLLTQEISSDTLSERQRISKSLFDNLVSEKMEPGLESQKRNSSDDLSFQQPSSRIKLDELLKVYLRKN